MKEISQYLIINDVYVESRGLSLISPKNIFFVSQMLIIDWSIT